MRFFSTDSRAITGLVHRGCRVDFSEEQQGYQSVDSSDTHGLGTACLHSGEAYYMSLFRDLPHGIVETNREGKIVFSNPAHHKMLGFPDGELIGRYIFDLIPDEPERLRYRAYLQNILAAQNECEPYRSQNVTRDGQVIDTLADWTHKRDEQNRITGFVAIITDITARVRAENDLRESEERYRLLAENATDIISRCSPGGRYTYVSRACSTILGYQPAELLGKNMQDFWCHDHIEKIRRVLGNIRHKERSNVIEYQFRKNDGAYVWLESTFRVVRGLKTGHVIELIVISRDISHRKEADHQRQKLQSRIQQLQKLESLGVLAGGIAHDFNNLLVGILGNADLAMMDISHAEPAYELMQNVKEAAMRASDLTNQMLAYAGKGKFVVRKIDLNELIRETSSLFSESDSKDAVLRYDLAKNLPAIEGDVSQIQQIVTNLVTNAIEAVGENTATVIISTKSVQADGDYLSHFYLGENLKEGLYVSFEVTDSGRGMDEEIRKRIFEPFFSTKFTGRGLGLAAVLGIVRGHNGGISVTSKPDEGTTFKILLPQSEIRNQTSDV